MALTAWISKLIPYQPSLSVVRPRESIASPVPIDNLPTLRDELAKMHDAAAPWCTTASPFLEPDETRAWLLQEATELAGHCSADPGIAQLAEQLVDTLTLPDLALAPAPRVAMELFALLRNEKVSIHNVQDVLKEDPALLKQVWIQASSAHFATPPRDLKYAIARVGLHQLGRLAAAEVISDRLFRSSVYRSRADQIRERSIVTGELLRQHDGDVDTYLCGLLHGVGSLIVLRAATQQTVPLSRTLPRILTRLDAPLGMLALSRWQLPERVCVAVGLQAMPSQAPEEHRDLARLCRASSLAVQGAQDMERNCNNGVLEALEALEGIPVEPEELLRDARALLLRHRDRV